MENIWKEKGRKNDDGLGEENSAHFTPVVDSKTVSNYHNKNKNDSLKIPALEQLVIKA